MCELSSPAGDVCALYSMRASVCVLAANYPDCAELQSAVTDRQMDDRQTEDRNL